MTECNSLSIAHSRYENVCVNYEETVTFRLQYDIYETIFIFKDCVHLQSIMQVSLCRIRDSKNLIDFKVSQLEPAVSHDDPAD